VTGKTEKGGKLKRKNVKEKEQKKVAVNERSWKKKSEGYTRKEGRLKERR